MGVILCILAEVSTSDSVTSADTLTCLYAEALARLDIHFTQAVNVVAEQYRFRER